MKKILAWLILGSVSGTLQAMEAVVSYSSKVEVCEFDENGQLVNQYPPLTQTWYPSQQVTAPAPETYNQQLYSIQNTADTICYQQQTIHAQCMQINDLNNQRNQLARQLEQQRRDRSRQESQQDTIRRRLTRELEKQKIENAIYHDDTPALQRHINNRNFLTNDLVCTAAEAGSELCLRLLLESRLDPSGIKNDRTPLHYACMNKRLNPEVVKNVVKILLKAGANPTHGSAHERDPRKPYLLATENAFGEAAQLLKDASKEREAQQAHWEKKRSSFRPLSYHSKHRGDDKHRSSH